MASSLRFLRKKAEAGDAIYLQRALARPLLKEKRNKKGKKG